MDILSLLIGLGVGILAGIALTMLVSYNNKSGKSESAAKHTESELKAILAAQARVHLDNSRSHIADLQRTAEALTKEISQYENSLRGASEQGENSKDTFFGEHAAVFLRNKIQIDKNGPVLASPDAQPRDFANNGSGVFSGAAAQSTQSVKE